MQQEQFLEAIAETAKLARLVQRSLKRAQAQCDGEVSEHLDVMTKRVFELAVRAQWLEHVALGKIKLQLDARGVARRRLDRRLGLDRRIEAMRKQLRLALRDG